MWCCSVMFIEFHRSNDPQLLSGGQQHSEHVTRADLFSCAAVSRDCGRHRATFWRLVVIWNSSPRHDGMCYLGDNTGRAQRGVMVTETWRQRVRQNELLMAGSN